jgi:hypothetical protein
MHRTLASFGFHFSRARSPVNDSFSNMKFQDESLTRRARRPQVDEGVLSGSFGSYSAGAQPSIICPSGLLQNHLLVAISKRRVSPRIGSMKTSVCGSLLANPTPAHVSSRSRRRGRLRINLSSHRIVFGRRNNRGRFAGFDNHNSGQPLLGVHEVDSH